MGSDPWKRNNISTPIHKKPAIPVPESLGEVVGVEDEFAGALDGAEQGDLRSVQYRFIAFDL
jgi:hypothetical protein